MYICLCHGVTDKHILEAIESGCGTYRDVRNATQVGTKCGKCACDAKCFVRETKGTAASCNAARPVEVNACQPLLASA